MDLSTVFLTKLTEISIFTLLEIIVGFFAAWYLLKKPMKNAVLSENERLRLLKEWEPEPLICKLPENNCKLKARIVMGHSGHYVIINNKKCLNLATHNYLSTLENNDIRTNAANTVHKYGVGSCGPRGFYGTLDVHLNLEDRIARFMNTEAAIVYSYAFSTIASAIPAYCKRGDIIFTDEKISFAAQKGIDASRSIARYYKHNDMNDLERLLKQQQIKSAQNPKKAKKQRLFLVVEAIYFNTGKLLPLDKIIQLRKQYKLRMILDESLTFGVLGATGRGITEYFNIDHEKEVDLIVSSLETSIGSTGGFCAGSHFIIEHQRLSGLGYCFSASSPPLLCQAAIDALDYIENNPNVITQLQKNCNYMHQLLINKLTKFNYESHALSPAKHLYLKKNVNYQQQEQILNSIVEYCENNGYAITTSNYLESEDKSNAKPSIRLSINANLDRSDMNNFVKTLLEAESLIQ